MNEFNRVLKNKNFLLIWSSQIMSQLTINVMNILVLIHIYDRTHSTVAASFIWVAYGIPAILVGPIAAAAVDLYDRRKTLIITNFAQAVAILIYSLLYQEFFYLSYGVVLAYSLMDQFYVPAEAATLPNLVDKDDLPKANGLFFISQQATAIIGFGFAGIFSEIIGFGSAMFIGTVLLFLAFIAVSRLPKQELMRENKKSVESGVWKFFSRMKEGYEFIRNRKTILYPFLLLMWLQISLAIMVVNFPAIGTEIVKTKPSLTGPLMIIPGGIGAMLGTFLVPKLMNRMRKKKIIETAILGLGVSLMIVSLIVPLLPFWPGRLILTISFAVVGFSYVSAMVPALTFLQTQTPKELMGRLFGNFWFLTTAATLIPVLFAATITEILGVNLLLVILGIAAGFVFFFSRFYLEKSYLSFKNS